MTASRQPLLFLAHRIPYPPNKGDKIRSWHMLRKLATGHDIHLGAFVDDPDDFRHLPAVREICSSVCLVPLRRRRAIIRSAAALFRGQPMTVPYYGSAAMRRWVADVLRRFGPRHAFAFSGAMAQYLEGCAVPGIRRVIDFVDVDSDKWAQYATSRRWPMRALYRREARTLARYEARVAETFDASVFVSEAEAVLFRRRAPGGAERVFAIRNGVDTGYFDPGTPGGSPYPGDERVIVFTGAMDYWANVDAVCWFAREVLPQVRADLPQARFYIVGARPTPEVRALDALEGVRVTGAVDDIRPYLGHAHLAVAPLRIARGVQNKVLEAMAMARPLLATSQALAGIGGSLDTGELLAEGPEAYVRKSLQILRTEKPVASPEFRAWVEQHFGWERSLDGLERLIFGAEDEGGVPSVPAHAVMETRRYA